MRVAGNLQVPSKRSRDILHQAKGITGIESTQIRWFSRWSGGGGWSGREKLSRGQEPQTKGQGTIRLPPQWATTKAARRGARGQNKELLSWQFTKETELKAALTGSTRRAKGSPPKKAQRLKRKDAYSRLQSCSCWGEWWRWWWGCWRMRTRSANHKSMWQRNGICYLSPESEG